MDVAGPVARLTLARPQRRNALDTEMLEEVVAALRSLDADEQVRAAIVAGEGGCFCAGLDRDQMQSDDEADRRRIYQASRAFHRALVSFTRPLIAAVDGYALGTGFDLAVLCDLRVATTRAVFGHPEVRLGGVPLFTPLKLVVGDGWARRLCLDGSPIDAGTAERIGLILEVVEPAELRERARALAASIAQAPLSTLRATKALFRAYPDPHDWLVSDHDDVFEAGATIRRHLDRR